MIRTFFRSPWYFVCSIILSLTFLIIDVFFSFSSSVFLLSLGVVVGGLPVFLSGIQSLFRFHLSIETFNAFAVALLLFLAMEALFFGWEEYGYTSLYVSTGILVLQFFYLAIRFSHSRRDFLWASIVFLYSISSCGVLFFVSSDLFQQVMIVGSSLFLLISSHAYKQLALSEKRLSSQGILFAMHFVSLFLFFGFFCAIHINYSIPQWLLALLFGLGAFLVSLHSFILTRPAMPRDALRYAFVMGFFFFQFSWFIHFWPFGYLTISAVLLVIFFSLWDLFQTHLEGTLKKQRFLMNMIFFAVLAGIVLASSPWSIVLE